MRQWRYLALAAVCWLAGAFASHAQIMADGSLRGKLPPPPPSGIRDEWGFFRTNQDAFKRITERVNRLKTRYDFQVYVVVESALLKREPVLWAMDLQQSWLPEGGGIVFVYDADGRNSAVGWDLGGVDDQKPVPNRIPSYEEVRMLSDASRPVVGNPTAAEHMESLVNGLTDEYEKYFTKQRAGKTSGIHWAMAAAVTLLLGGASVAVFRWLAVSPSSARFQAYYFPDTDVHERLGAPYGGGNVSSRSFARRSRPEKDEPAASA